MSGVNLRFEHGFPVMGTLKLGAPKKAAGAVVMSLALVTALDHDEAAAVLLSDPLVGLSDKARKVGARAKEDAGERAIRHTVVFSGFDAVLEVQSTFDGEPGGDPFEVEGTVLRAELDVSSQRFRHTLRALVAPKANVPKLLSMVGDTVQVRVVRALGAQQALPFGELTYVAPEPVARGTQLELSPDDDSEEELPSFLAGPGEEELPPEADEPAEKPKRKRVRADVQPTVLDGEA